MMKSGEAYSERALQEVEYLQEPLTQQYYLRCSQELCKINHRSNERSVHIGCWWTAVPETTSQSPRGKSTREFKKQQTRNFDSPSSTPGIQQPVWKHNVASEVLQQFLYVLQKTSWSILIQRKAKNKNNNWTAVSITNQELYQLQSTHEVLWMQTTFIEKKNKMEIKDDYNKRQILDK
jgi:hypothetical protein